MAMPEFAEIELRGSGDGSIGVWVDGKLLGPLFQTEGRFCVELYPRVVGSVSAKHKDAQ